MTNTDTGLCFSRTCRSTGHRPERAGETRVAFPLPARTGVLANTRSLWQGPSPLPQRCAGITTGRGPKPPASARPATGGRFAPAGSGAGLCFSRTCRSTGDRRARAGETRVAFPVPARTGDGTFTASMAGAITPAIALRRDQDRLGAKSPRQAPAPPPAGASRPPGRALAYVPPGPTGLHGTVPRGRGKRDAFPVPARTGESTFTTSMAGAGHKARTKPLTNTDTGRGLWPPAGPEPCPAQDRGDDPGQMAQGARGQQCFRFAVSQPIPLAGLQHSVCARCGHLVSYPAALRALRDCALLTRSQTMAEGECG